jgi:hypothetical protein
MIAIAASRALVLKLLERAMRGSIVATGWASVTVTLETFE